MCNTKLSEVVDLESALESMQHKVINLEVNYSYHYDWLIDSDSHFNCSNRVKLTILINSFTPLTQSYSI